MRRLTDRLFVLLIAVAGLGAMLLGIALSGCGGANAPIPSNPSSPTPAAPQQAFLPNYLGDLDRVLFWKETVVTYRILAPTSQATSIREQPIPCIWATNGQIDSIREGFQKWEKALDDKRIFVEVSAADTSANIDVVVQLPSQFGDELGNTQIYVIDSAAGRLGRSVIRLNGKLAERVFRRTVLHEAGHSIFASGHSSNNDDIMYASLPRLQPVIELSERDVNSVRAAYRSR